ncbi:MAG: MlaD family protein [Kiritimatiellia bacterium]
MKRINSRLRELFLEMLVGAFMFVVLLSLSFFTIILSRESFFAQTYPLEVVFEDVMGLRDGDNVVIRGMTVGKVKRLELRDDGVHVFANLQRPVQMRENYNVRVVPSSFLGGRYLQVDAGPDDAPLMPQDAVVRGEKPLDLMASAAVVVDDFKAITAKIRSGEGTLGKLVNDEELYQETTAAIGDVRRTLDDIRETSPLVTFTSILFGAL